MRKMNLVALLILALALVCQYAFAETGVVSPIHDSSLTSQDTVCAYYLYPTSKEAEEMHHQTKAFPAFDVSDKVVSQLFSLQGVEAQFPVKPPYGYERERNVSLRKMSYGTITEKQLLFNTFFAQGDPTVITNADHSVEYRYDVPVSLLMDIAYAGTRYVNPNDEDNVIFLICLFTPSEFPLTIVKYPYNEILGDDLKWEKIESSSADGENVYYLLERLSGDTLFINAISSESYEAMRYGSAADDTEAEQVVVMYEASSDSASAMVLREFIHNAITQQR